MGKISAELLMSMIRDIIDFGKIQSNCLQPNNAVVNIKEMFERL